MGPSGLVVKLGGQGDSPQRAPGTQKQAPHVLESWPSCSPARKPGGSPRPIPSPPKWKYELGGWGAVQRGSSVNKRASSTAGELLPLRLHCVSAKSKDLSPLEVVSEML